jgi:hypothetical protein
MLGCAIAVVGRCGIASGLPRHSNPEHPIALRPSCGRRDPLTGLWPEPVSTSARPPEMPKSPRKTSDSPCAWTAPRGVRQRLLLVLGWVWQAVTVRRSGGPRRPSGRGILGPPPGTDDAACSVRPCLCTGTAPVASTMTSPHGPRDRMPAALA